MFNVMVGRRGRVNHQMALLRCFSVFLMTALLFAPVGVSAAPAASGNACKLNSARGQIQHVIYLQFDNTHFTRDNPNVPSDLEQMPHLLNFITDNGTLMANDHTVLMSHTATGILTSLTGVYPDRMGQPVSNTFRYFNPNGTTNPGVAFAYWTSPLYDYSTSTPTDTTPEMINENGKIAPAPWVPYTRAGCDFGSVGTANTILENTAIDVKTVFGTGSPEDQEVSANPAQAFADFVGIGVHCAQGSVICSAANNGRPDLLPDELGGYTGFNGLFGAKYVNPVIKSDGPMTDLNGNVIQDATGHVGFPGFDGMEPTVTLSWIAQMQEAGIPVTYGYLSDAHDGHGTSGNIHFAYAPGETGYVQQLHDYDIAFQKFFDRLAADGINKSNTLFVFTVDEGDHFAGGAPTPAGCDGVSTPCTYNQVGEINANLSAMVRTQFGDTTPFSVHSDTAPNVYITGNPSQTDPAARNLEREMAHLNWLNPYTGTVENNVMVALADQTGMKTLHMVTADPVRIPTFTPFADPDWFFYASGSPATCATPDICAYIPARSNFSYAWNHGDIQSEISTIWVGIVGPGVANNGIDGTTWMDHTDVRPTMLALAGLKDDYIQDGRVLSEILTGWAKPTALKLSGHFIPLSQTYKQLNAPFGQFSMDALVASTKALGSGSVSDDSMYTSIEAQIASLTSQRDALAVQIKTVLNDAAFNDQIINNRSAQDLIRQAAALMDQMHTLATTP